jgi:hypothetical protein
MIWKVNVHKIRIINYFSNQTYFFSFLKIDFFSHLTYPLYSFLIYCYFFYLFRTVVFYFTLSLWAIKSLVLDYPSSVSVMYEFILIEWALSQISYDYSHELSATIVTAYHAGRTWLYINNFVAVFISLLVMCRVHSCTKDARTYSWRLFVGASSNSEYVVSFVGVIFSNETLVSVCELQPIALETTCVVWGFPWEPFGQYLN